MHQEAALVVAGVSQGQIAHPMELGNVSRGTSKRQLDGCWMAAGWLHGELDEVLESVGWMFHVEHRGGSWMAAGWLPAELDEVLESVGWMFHVEHHRVG